RAQDVGLEVRQRVAHPVGDQALDGVQALGGGRRRHDVTPQAFVVAIGWCLRRTRILRWRRRRSWRSRPFWCLWRFQCRGLSARGWRLWIGPMTRLRRRWRGRRVAGWRPIRRWIAGERALPVLGLADLERQG